MFLIETLRKKSQTVSRTETELSDVVENLATFIVDCTADQKDGWALFVAIDWTCAVGRRTIETVSPLHAFIPTMVICIAHSVGCVCRSGKKVTVD